MSDEITRSTPLEVDVIEHYEVEGLIGQGSMGRVFSARDTVLDRRVAIKLLSMTRVAESDFVDRFRLEARALARLHHPGIVTIYGFGWHQSIPYLVMEHLDGGSLEERQRRPMQRSLAIDLINSVAEALDYAHDRGVIHRDVKPSNILLDREDRTKLTDFGLAKVRAITLTMAGQVFGSPAYMAPEQVKGIEVSRSTDVYALGVVAYELLTGRTPFEGSMAEVFECHVHHQPRSPREFDRSIPDKAAKAILEALEKDPGKRVPTASQFARALASAFEGSDDRMLGVSDGLERERTPAPAQRRDQAAETRFEPPRVVEANVQDHIATFYSASSTTDNRATTHLPPGGPSDFREGRPVSLQSSNRSGQDLAAKVSWMAVPVVLTLLVFGVIAFSIRDWGRPTGSATHGTASVLTSTEVVGTVPLRPTRRTRSRAARLNESLIDAEVDLAGAIPKGESTEDGDMGLQASEMPVATVDRTTQLPPALSDETAAIPVPTPTPQPQIELLVPDEGARLTGLVEMAWRWPGQLASDEFFDVRICITPTCTPRFGKTNTRESRWRWLPDAGTDSYRWQVVVIQRAGNEVIGEGATSSIREFVWSQE